MSSRKRKRRAGAPGPVARAATKDKRGPHVRFWMFTDNGKKGSEGKELKSQPWTTLPDGVKYLTWQLERAPTSGHLHLQGYIELSSAQYSRWLHNHISATGCFFVREGTQAQACTYANKSKSRQKGPFWLGVKAEGTKGARTDLESFRDAIATGATLKDLTLSHLPQLARYGRLYDRLKALYRPRRRRGDGPDIALLIGLPGTGKTLSVYEAWEDDDQFYDMPSVGASQLWVDGYDSHCLVLMDEFTGASSRMDLDVLLKLIDSYPRRLQVKGSFTHFYPKRLAITSNVHPLKWYDWNNRHAQYFALRRRIKSVWIYFKLGEKPKLADEEFWWDPVLYPRPLTLYNEKSKLDYQKLLGAIWTDSRRVEVQDLGECNHWANFCTGKCKATNKKWYDWS